MSFLRFIFPVLTAAACTIPVCSSPLLPGSAVGTGKAVHITNDRQLLVLSGGRYNGTVDGFDVDLWCVDVERFAATGQTYTANVVPLLPWRPEQAALVRKGGFSSEDFYWSDLGLGAVERYQAAAWLITQMAAYRHGASVTSDLHIQQAIWGILDDAEFQSIALTPLAVAWMHTAAAFIRENPDFGLGDWAIISGNAAADGTFTGWEYQSFLTRLDQVSPALRPLAPDEGPDGVHSPEPGTFALAAAGLILAALALRRRG
ncbi:MAG: PEP-CTERM sorting domain-containing protein [Bryobacteraceae bacterium]